MMRQEDKESVLPIEVPNVDILSFLRELKFSIDQFSSIEERAGVSGTYIDALLYMYHEFGGRKDILGTIIEKNIVFTNSEQKEDLGASDRIRRQFMTTFVPWPLYELVAEEVRQSLANSWQTSEHTNPTYFSFLLGFYGVINEPALVAAATLLPLERIIETANKYNRKMNKVTTVEMMKKSDKTKEKYLKAELRRHQNPVAIEYLDTLLKEQTKATPEERNTIIDAICYRDLATTLGAYFGGTMLAGKPARGIHIVGDPRATIDIELTYANIGNNVFYRLGQLVTAGNLFLYKRFGQAHAQRDQFMDESLGRVWYVFKAEELQKTKDEAIRLEREKVEAEANVSIARAEKEAEAAKRQVLEARIEFEQTVGDINRTVGMMRGIFHDLKNDALAIRAKAIGLLVDIGVGDPEYGITGEELRSEILLENKVTRLSTETHVPTGLQKAATYVKDVQAQTEKMLLTAQEGMKGQLTTRMEQIKYATLLEDAVRQIAPMYPAVNITYNCPEDLVITVDQKYISAALKNIIDNAAHASVPKEKESGRGVVSLEVRTIPKKAKTYIETTMYQTGVMSEGVAEKLNAGEVFTTKGAKGNGIGSSASYGIIKEMHNGSIKYSYTQAESSACVKIVF